MDDVTQEAPRGVFVIDGEECPFPELAEGFDMDEAMVFYEYTGHPIEDLFIEVEEDDEEAVAAYELKLRNPKTMAALMHLAYSRAHPKMAAASIKKLVKQTDFVEAFSKLVAEDDESPPGDEVWRNAAGQTIDDILAFKNQREHGIFWQRFHGEFGAAGRTPRSYYDFRVGHVLHLSPGNLGGVKPSDLMGAVDIFNALFPEE